MDHADPTSSTDARPDDEPADSGPAAVSDDGSGDQPARSTLTPGFLAELAKAMHAAADQERERIETAVSEDAAAHAERARARGAVETDELRRLAEEDLQRIKDWSTAETARIRAEAARRSDERRAALEEFLRQHDAIIESEVAGVDDAVTGYGGTLTGFFAELRASTDPAEIARRAGMLPPPPDLEEVRATARAAAVARFAEGSQTDGAGAAAEASAADEAGAGGDAVAGDNAGSGSTDAADGDGQPLVGVMDPDAVDAASGPPPDVLRPVEGEQEPATAGAADAGDGSEGQAEEAATVASVAIDQPGAAARLMRSISTWTSPAGRDAREAELGTPGAAPDQPS
jgi:hypothetical protein